MVWHRILIRWFLAAAILLLGCRTTPITGRRQLLILPESNEIKMGLKAFDDVMAEEQRSSNDEMRMLVERVGNRIAEVANRPDYEWEFQLIQSAEMNAFCLPGGKVAVYEGILPVCQTEAGLAVVMSHEIAHALARHGGERISQEAAVTGIGKIVDYATLNRTQLTRDRVNKAFGVASKYGFTLPYSRKHELEADHMGILLMAQAGYDPREAPRFWQRFGSMQATQERPIEFLSTHPADERRAAELSELVPEALALYEQVQAPIGLGARLPLEAMPRPTVSPEHEAATPTTSIGGPPTEAR